MKNEADEKMIKRSISLPPAVLAHAQSRADAREGGNLSRYLLKLVEADLLGNSGNGEVEAGAAAFLSLRALDDGRVAAGLQRAVADRRPFTEITESLAGGDPVRLALLRRAYDFLTGTMPRGDLPPIMTVLLEIRERLRGPIEFPMVADGPQSPYGEIPNSPVNQLLSEEKRRRAGRAGNSGATPRQRRTGGDSRPEGRAKGE